MRISVSVTEELLKQLDEAAGILNINRSAYISIAVQEKIKNDNIATNLPKITDLMQEALARQARNLDTTKVEKDLKGLMSGNRIEDKN